MASCPMHSVFKDGFEFPSDDGLVDGHNKAGIVSEMYEGLLPITLVGDRGKDVVHLLRPI